LNGELSALLHRLWGKDTLEYSIFFGSPGPGQKTTMQVFRGCRILGYVKLTDSEDIFKRFEQETSTLRYLQSKGVEHIPEALFTGKVDGKYVFVQSTNKTLHSKVVEGFTLRHLEFVELLCQSTLHRMPFEDTALSRDLAYLQAANPVLPSSLQGIYKDACKLVVGHYVKRQEFCFMHGDFTPWNIYEESGTLYPFDFEFACDGYPAYIDLVHYLLQIRILVEKDTLEVAFAHLETQKHWIPAEDRNFLILAYLLHIIAHYMRLFDGRSMSEDNGFIIWTGLIEKYKNLCVIKES
jgi:thiamine kinase-like enzyme